MINTFDGFEELFKKFKMICYQIGAMEKTALNDDGGGQRINLYNELLLRGVYPINPVLLETVKTGIPTKEMKEKMNGWVSSGNWELFGESSNKIWNGVWLYNEKFGPIYIPGDCEYVRLSNFIIFSYHKGDLPCGSFFEAGLSAYRNKSLYLITDIAKKDLPKSLLQWLCISKGEVFKTDNEFLTFVDKKYNLKRKAN
jgi:hypothetical protein